MIVYFADRYMNILGQASTKLPHGLTITEDLKIDDVETGVSSFECVIPFDDSTTAELEKCCKVGNYILRSHNNETEFYTIIESEKDTGKQEVEIYAEDAGLDLLNEVVGSYEADKAYDLAYYVNKYIADSGFEIGINEAKGLSRKLSWEGEATATERIASIATQFGGFEVSYTFDIKGLTVTKMYVNIFKQRGKDLGVELRLNKQVDRIITTESIYNVATALQCVGGVPEDKEDPITLQGYKLEDDENGDFYISGDRLYSREALKKWNRFKGKDGHIVRQYSYDTTNQKTLCEHAKTELKKLREIEVNYEIEIKELPDNVQVGDRVNVVDEKGELFLSARLLQLKTSVCDQTHDAVLGEYLIKDDGISSTVEKLASDFAERVKILEFMGAIKSNILRCTNTMAEISGSGNATWEKGGWNKSGTGKGERSIIDIAPADSPVDDVSKGFKLEGNSDDSGSSGVVQDAVLVTNGKVYTQSCYARGTGTLVLQSGTDEKTFELTDENEWVKYSNTFTAEDENANTGEDLSRDIGYQNSGSGTIEICAMKLEIGDKATKWLPAAEDASISSVFIIPDDAACVDGRSYTHNNRIERTFYEYVKTDEVFFGNTTSGVLLEGVFTTTDEQVYFSDNDFAYYCEANSTYYRVEFRKDTATYNIPQFSVGSEFELKKHPAGVYGTPGEVEYHKGQYLYEISQNKYNHLRLLAHYTSPTNAYNSHIDMYPAKMNIMSSGNINVRSGGNVKVDCNTLDLTINDRLYINGRPWFVNSVLWGADLTTGWHMNQNQTVNLSEAISEQPRGIVLVFCAYLNQGGVISSNYGWQHFFIPKEMVSLADSDEGKEFTFELCRSKFEAVGTKCLYIGNTSIKGHDDNDATGTAASGITYANNQFVLRYVIGV